jgi:hypothetical protein
VVEVVTAVGAGARSGRSAFHGTRTSTSASVSKVSGSSPGAGIVAILVPRGTVAVVGALGRSSRVKESTVVAEIAGRGS